MCHPLTTNVARNVAREARQTIPWATLGTYMNISLEQHTFGCDLIRWIFKLRSAVGEKPLRVQTWDHIPAVVGLSESMYMYGLHPWTTVHSDQCPNMMVLACRDKRNHQPWLG